MNTIINNGLDSYVLGKVIGIGNTCKCYSVKEGASRTGVDSEYNEQANTAHGGECSDSKIILKIIDLNSKKRKQDAEVELNIHTMLNHPNIVKLHTSFTYYKEQKPWHIYSGDNGQEKLCVILEFCRYGSLFDSLRLKDSQGRTKTKRLEEDEVAYILHSLLQALGYIHNQGIVHRDIKLGNILVAKDMTVKLADFGMSTKCRPDEELLSMCGTPNYLAPEILTRDGYNKEIDIWSLGVVIYMLLTGVAPFETHCAKETYNRIRKVSYSIPDTLSTDAKDLIQNILVKNPMNRMTISEIQEHPFLSNRPQCKQCPSSLRSKLKLLF
jgi:serine/threonine protein kinase